MPYGALQYMTRLSFLLLPALALCALGLVSGQAFAQAQLPEVSLQKEIPMDSTNEASLVPSFDEAFAAIKNPLLSDQIKLQYQIELLDKMTARQAALEQIAESYAKLGIEYKAPAPPLTLCRQLPPNALCIKYYPDVYKDIVDARKAAFEARKPPVIEIAPPKLSDGTPAPVAARAPAKPVAAYYWSDIQCLSGQCRAVVTSMDNPASRRRVRVGDRLSDKSVVRSISASGVEVVKEKETLSLMPAPLTATEVAVATPEPRPQAPSSDAPSMSAPSVSAAPADDFPDDPLPAPSRQQALLPAAQGVSGNDAGEQALGPSGLF